MSKSNDTNIKNTKYPVIYWPKHLHFTNERQFVLLKLLSAKSEFRILSAFLLETMQNKTKLSQNYTNVSYQ